MIYLVKLSIKDKKELNNIEIITGGDYHKGKQNIKYLVNLFIMKDIIATVIITMYYSDI